ncbi:MAG: helix-turn-helix transcriptional regulator [Rhizomicrobium sp.]
MQLAQIFAANLRQYRRAKKLKQWQLAELVDLGTKAISDYEVGRTEPSFEIIARLAQALDIAPAALFGVGIGMTLSNQRGKFMNRINSALSRLNEDELTRAAKMLEAFAGK